MQISLHTNWYTFSYTGCLVDIHAATLKSKEGKPLLKVGEGCIAEVIPFSHHR